MLAIAFCNNSLKSKLLTERVKNYWKRNILTNACFGNKKCRWNPLRLRNVMYLSAQAG